ncbi:MAG: DNA polymerase III subunit beta [Ruminococcus sp.]|nr:DNA polymerase III subunit beta [Ruminococcus sp.]
MRFTCGKAALSEAISCVSRAVSQKSTIEALEGIKVTVSPGSVELTGYNLELGIRTAVPAQTDDTGSFVVSTRLFSEFTRHMDGNDLTFDIGEGFVITLSSGESECSFPAMSADEYPDLPVVDSERSFTVKQTVIKSMVNMTSYAASTNESKPILTGELFDIADGQFNMVAIDGFRLAIRTEIADPDAKYHFVVPKKALQEVSTLVKDDPEAVCVICTNERHIIFQVGRVFVISRLLEGNFHNYRLSIPTSHKTEIIISKRELAASLDRCSLIIDDKNKSPIRFEAADGKVRIVCKTGNGRVKDSIAADISGEAITIGFNNKLMAEAVKAAEGDKVRIRFNGAMKVIEILPLDGDSYMFLVMPIQLRN